MNLLTVVTFLPLVGALVLVLLPASEAGQLRAGALTVALATMFLSFGLWMGFDASAAAPEFQFEV